MMGELNTVWTHTAYRKANEFMPLAANRGYLGLILVKAAICEHTTQGIEAYVS